MKYFPTITERMMGLACLIGVAYVLLLPRAAHAEPAVNAPSIDPVLLKQIQETVEQEIKQRQADFAKRRTDLISITDPTERARKEQELNTEETKSDEHLLAQRARIETEFIAVAPNVASAPTDAPQPINTRTPASTTPDAQGSATLAGFDLNITQDELLKRYPGFKCEEAKYSQPGIPEVKVSASQCISVSGDSTVTSFSFYQGRVYRFATRLPKGVTYGHAVMLLAEKTGSTPKIISTEIRDPSHHQAECGATANFFGGNAFVLVWTHFDVPFTYFTKLEDYDFDFKDVSADKDDSCNLPTRIKDFDAREGGLIFYKNKALEDQIDKDVANGVQRFKNSNKSGFSL